MKKSLLIKVKFFTLHGKFSSQLVKKRAGSLYVAPGADRVKDVAQEPYRGGSLVLGLEPPTF